MKLLKRIAHADGCVRWYVLGRQVFSHKNTQSTIADMPCTPKNIEHTAALAPVQKTVSIIMPVYQNDSTNFQKVMAHYAAFSSETKQGFQIIFIDDASPVPVEITPDCDVNISVYRVLEDIPWNIPGARNLGVMCADTPNIAFIDLDHLFPEETIKALIHYTLEDTEILLFDRYKDGAPHHIHPATFFMQKSLFLKLNGCDEDFAGHYGSDKHLRACISAYGCTVITSNLRVDTSTKIESQHTLVRDTSHNDKIMAEKNTAPLVNHSKKMLRFAWEFVAQSKAKPIRN